MLNRRMTQQTNARQVSVVSGASVAGATTALVLLTALNFVNYIDRYILPGVQEQVKGEFRITDEQIGSLTLWFMLAYMLTSPITGWLGDRFPRKPMIVVAALFWGGINLLTATVHSYDSLNLRHAALGIGEASFGIFAPAILADFYPEDQRNRVLTIFNVAIPVGAALGYLVGGTVGERFGWRTSFIVSAVPAIVIALLIAIFMKEPSRSRSEGSEAKFEKSAILSLLKKPCLHVLHPWLRCGYVLARWHLLVDALVSSAGRRPIAEFGSLSDGSYHRSDGSRRNNRRRRHRAEMVEADLEGALPCSRHRRGPCYPSSAGLFLRSEDLHSPQSRDRHLSHLSRYRAGKRRDGQCRSARDQGHCARGPALPDPCTGRCHQSTHHRRRVRSLHSLRRSRVNPHHARACRDHLLCWRAICSTDA